MITLGDNRIQDQKRLLTGSEVLHLGRDEKDPVYYRVKQVSFDHKVVVRI